MAEGKSHKKRKVEYARKRRKMFRYIEKRIRNSLSAMEKEALARLNAITDEEWDNAVRQEGDTNERDAPQS